VKSYHSFIKIIAVLTIVTAILVITGWFGNIEDLKSVIVGLPTMKFNTAICFLLSGISLLLIIKPKKNTRNIQVFISLIIFFIGALTFSEHIFKINIGIDELIVKDPNTKYNLPGRMAITTALCFILISFSFAAFALGKKKIHAFAQYSLHIITLISFIAAVGYLYNLPTFYTLSILSSMALNTSILFIMLSVAGSLINYKLGITGLFTGTSIGSLMAKRVFPVIVVVVVVLGYLHMELYWNNMLAQDFGIAIFSISFLVLNIVVIYLTANHLNKIDAKRSIAETALQTINKNLEQLVAERTDHIQLISERLTLAAKGANLGIWDWDIVNDKLTWNDKMYQLYGVTPQNFSGAYQAWENGLHPDDISAGRKAIDDAITGNKDFDTEFRVIWPDKSVHYIKGNAFVKRDDSGKALRMVGTNWDITEQKKHLLLIEENEKKFKALLEAAPDALIIVNKEGNIQLINQQTEKMFGYTAAELIDNKIEILIPDKDKEAHPNLRNGFVQNPRLRGMGEGKELFARKKNGELITVEISLSPLQTRDGILIIASIRDVSRRKKAEEEIKLQQKRFEGIFNSAHQFIGLMSPHGILLEVNKTALLIANTKPEDVIGKPIWECHWCLLNPEVFKKATARAANGEFVRENVQILGMNDQKIWVDFSLKPIFNENNEVSFLIPEGRDITEELNLQLTNREQEEKIRLFVKHTPAAVAMFDMDMRYIIASDKWYTDYGLTDRDIIGKSHYDIFPEVINNPEWFDLIKRSLNGSVEINEEAEFKLNNGITGWVKWEIRPWKKYDGSRGGIIIFTEMITDKVLARKKLHMLNEELVQSNKELEQFAYVASHDLQEPLRMVSSFMQLLNKKYTNQLDDTAKQYIHFAVDGAERMKVLILDLLTFSRIGTEKQYNQTIDVKILVEEVKLNLVAAVSENKAKITIHALPVIKGNKMQITQLFQNLLSNAIKYHSDRDPEIEIGYTDGGNHYQFYVKDNGIGIASKYFEKIFIIFQRLHNKTEYSGTGVGLSICKKIVEKHGGKIFVESEPGKGSTFYFTINKT